METKTDTQIAEMEKMEPNRDTGRPQWTHKYPKWRLKWTPKGIKTKSKMKQNGDPNGPKRTQIRDPNLDRSGDRKGSKWTYKHPKWRPKCNKMDQN